ncbi:MAG: peptidyl-prolyl cis-trans isomerase [Fibrobacterota bacterium]|nr:peptidyl-prolyl cis-trans isomerase [Fibrobacterota bacterium]
MNKTAIWSKTPPVIRIVAFAVMATLALACLSGCKKEAGKTTVLAKVGDSTLTLEELRESFPVEFEQLIRREQYLDFIKRWMDDEVVYQQALKANLESDSVVARKLEKLRRKLLIEEFLARENASEMFEPDELSMSQYYEMHKEEFRRKAPEFKYAHIRVQTHKQAMDLRSKANRGDFLAVAAAGSLDPVPESYASIGFKKQSEFPPCLSQDIAGAGIGSVTLPVACTDGFYLVKVQERQDAGSLIPFTEAKEEISGILIMERKDKLLEGRIAKYKEGISVGYNLDQIPGQAEDRKTSESPIAAEPAVSAAAASQSFAKPIASSDAVAPAVAPVATASKTDVDRLPREPGFSEPQEPGTPALREPSQDNQIAPAKPRIAARKRPARVAKPVDTLAAQKPAAEANPETTGQKPESEENTNAQNPTETP